MTRKKNIELWNHLLKELNDFEIQAGWFEDSRYDANTPVAGIAAVQNFGATIDCPGGTPYFIGSDGLAQFVSKNSVTGRYLIKNGLVTKQHWITIPARPFMEYAKARIQGEEGKEILLQEFIRVFSGKQTTKQAAARLKEWVVNIIKEEIQKMQTPALAASTVRNRKKRYSSKTKKANPKTTAKPLVDTGIMLAEVQGKVEIK